MEVFRITLKKWSAKLVASGFAARWNSNGIGVIYAAQSRSLACLENLVHRSGFGLNGDFATIIIIIPKSVSVEYLKIETLPQGWNQLDERAHLLCRSFGDNWVQSQTSCVLVVPSAIINGEFNVLINPNHKDFSKISIKSIESFIFDDRLQMKS